MNELVKDESVYVIGLFWEGYENGVQTQYYDFILNREGGYRSMNLGDMAKIVKDGHKTPVVIGGRDRLKGFKDLYQSKVGGNLIWYSDIGLEERMLYKPYLLRVGDILVRYKLRESEAGVVNSVKNEGGNLVEYRLNEDDVILITGLGIEEIVQNLSKYVSIVKGVL